MTAAINAAETNGVIAMLVLSLVGTWIITQLRVWRTHLPVRHGDLVRPGGHAAATGWAWMPVVGLQRCAVRGRREPERR
jgi:hypothetical protein